MIKWSYMQHTSKQCSVNQCGEDATYWIGAQEGFVENLFNLDVPHTFYLCTDHMSQVSNHDADAYEHIRIDTGEIFQMTIGRYSCQTGCEECANA